MIAYGWSRLFFGVWLGWVGERRGEEGRAGEGGGALSISTFNGRTTIGQLSFPPSACMTVQEYPRIFLRNVTPRPPLFPLRPLFPLTPLPRLFLPLPVSPFVTVGCRAFFVQIDVMVLYTETGLSWAGGVSPEQMETMIVESMVWTNEAFVNSELALQFNIVHMGPVSEL